MGKTPKQQSVTIRGGVNVAPVTKPPKEQPPEPPAEPKEPNE